MESYLWNRYARVLSGGERLACLEKCAFAFFEEPEMRPKQANDDSDFATLLYKKLLGLELPYAIQLPKECMDISRCKSDVFLWLNYLSFLAARGLLVEFEQALHPALEKLSLESKAVIRAEYVFRENSTLTHTVMDQLLNPIFVLLRYFSPTGWP